MHQLVVYKYIYIYSYIVFLLAHVCAVTSGHSIRPHPHKVRAVNLILFILGSRQPHPVHLRGHQTQSIIFNCSTLGAPEGRGFDQPSPLLGSRSHCTLADLGLGSPSKGGGGDARCGRELALAVPGAGIRGGIFIGTPVSVL